MLVLLGSSVRLLLSFLGTTTKSQHKVKSGFLFVKHMEQAQNENKKTRLSENKRQHLSRIFLSTESRSQMPGN